MHYGFEEDEKAFRGELRRWAEKMLAPHYLSGDDAAEFRRQQALDMEQTCPTSLRIPDEYGGQDLRAVIAGIAAEEVSRADFNTGYLIINTALTTDIIVRNCTDEQKQAGLPRIASGEALPCIMSTEPGAGTDERVSRSRPRRTARTPGYSVARGRRRRSAWLPTAPSYWHARPVPTLEACPRSEWT